MYMKNIAILNQQYNVKPCVLATGLWHLKKKRFSLSTQGGKTYLVPLRYFYAVNRYFLALNQKGRLNISILGKSQLSSCRHTANFQKLKLEIEMSIRLAKYSFSSYGYAWFIYTNRTNKIHDDLDLLFQLQADHLGS